MKNEHKISLISIIYSALASIIVFIIFDWDLALWVILGSAVSMFNYSILIQSNKGTMTTAKIVGGIAIRWVMMIVVIGFTALRTNFESTPLILLLIGLVATKIAAVLFYLLPFKKEVSNVSTSD